MKSTPLPKRKRVRTINNQPSMTEQTHARECDINNIIKKFTETGILPTNQYENGQYGFAPEIDFKTALDLVKNTQREYDELDPTEKALFGHNSDNYADFLQNYEEAPVEFEDDSPAKPDTLVSKTSTDSKENVSDTNTEK
nr:MAG: internal scaffolding protein [Microvirus sp.]